VTKNKRRIKKMPNNNAKLTIKLVNRLKASDAPGGKSIVQFILKTKNVDSNKKFPRYLINETDDENDSEEIKIAKAPDRIKLKITHNKKYFKHRRLKLSNDNCSSRRRMYRRSLLFGPKRWIVTISGFSKKNIILNGPQTTVTVTDKQ
jgi:hypothetical protein